MTLKEKGNLLLQNLIYSALAASAMGWFGFLMHPARVYLLYVPLTAILFTLTYLGKKPAWLRAGLYQRVLMTFVCGIAWIIMMFRLKGTDETLIGAFGQTGNLMLLVAVTGYMALVECPVNAVSAALITVILSAGLWFGRTAVFVPVYLLPLLVCLGACFVPAELEEMPRLRPLVSSCLVAALLATAIVPGEGIESGFLREAADQVVKTTIALFNLDKDELESRRPFNVGTYGWRTRTETFGGPVYPTDDEIMEVTADTGLYLRGAIRYTYNGRGWVDESNESKAGKIKRYMTSGLEGLIYASEYRRAMDLDTIGDNSAFTAKEATVRMLSDNDYWSLYTPSRTEKVTAAGDVNLYYNNLGEVFAARKLRTDDVYSFTYYAFDGSEADLRDAVNAAENGDDPAYAAVLAMNRDVPGGIDAGLYALVSSLIADKSCAYDRAMAICNYLKTNGTYTLTPSYPPENRDFVSYFVLEDLRGYCLYYASAMTLMARMAGLPARYVEGYLCPAGEDGTATLTGRDAHAWCEVYMKGFGWVTFDATASTPDDKNERDTSGNRGGFAQPTPDPDGGRPTPTPTPTPTPEPQSENTPNPDNRDENQDNEPDETPTPEPGPAELDGDDEPTPPPEQPDEPEDPDSREDGGEGSTAGGKAGKWLLAILLLAALAYGSYRLYLRIKAVSPELCAANSKNGTDALMVWYRSILDALSSRGIRYLNGDTPAEFASRAVEAGAAPERLKVLSAEIARLRYSGEKPTKALAEQAQSVYRSVVSRMNPADRARWLLMRIKNGIGSIEQLP